MFDLLVLIWDTLLDIVVPNMTFISKKREESNVEKKTGQFSIVLILKMVIMHVFPNKIRISSRTKFFI